MRLSKSIEGLVILVLTSTPPHAYADSYAPFRNFREVDATGRFYVVVNRDGGDPEHSGSGTPITFEFAERRPGSSPLASTKMERSPRDDAANPALQIRPGDMLLGKGKLERCPGRILISSTGLGFVGLDVAGHNYGSLRSRDALVVVSADGTVRHRKSMIDLFSEAEIRRFTRSTGSIWWCDGGWIDERKKEIVVVVGVRIFEDPKDPISRRFRIVDLETGKTRDSSSDVVLAALSQINLGALDQALDLSAELGLAQAKPDLVKIFSDETIPMMSRLKAAVALGSMGDRWGSALMRKVAFEKSSEGYYAITHLPAVLGDEAAAVLCDIVRESDGDSNGGAWQAMHSVSSKAAVPSLLQLLREGKPEYVDFAVESLGIMGPEAKVAVPDLIKLLELRPKTDRPLWTLQLTALVLGRIGPDAKAALPLLIRLAEMYAPDEWKKAKSDPPKPHKDLFGKKTYSNDYFVNAILTIGQK